MQRGKLTQNIALAAILSFTVFAAFAAFAANDSAILAVKGRIVPPACDLKLSDSVVDFGDIHPGDLKWGEFTLLTERKMTLSINCSAPSRVALHAKDYRTDSLVEPIGVDMGGGKGITKGTNYIFGLGQTGTSKIGAFSIVSTADYLVDGKKLFQSSIQSSNGGVTWSGRDRIYITQKSSNTMASFKKEGNENPNVPIPFKTLSTQVVLRAAINKPSELDFTKELKLDGSIAIELVYL
ncbi:DUF1120 domain-containing protein [Serratia fonticola]|uniref:DUF1120 domain-containing protein n=1 Tax=Serratia fonticola TaxID=47917 RepID=UPI0024DEAFCB|nr:DUF1120 domain-containing protein [Serratia fonticola]MDK2375048.1 DUF1120 domain-containing protein [Serratia fonticola]